ncbi:unnamed protein product [Rotaria socialis]|uniref:Spectrin beta chain n=2 Tax=Rotaria socialis TaxID=392032 RepID=A0A817NQJ5_9BILA|nr:unnamed protein product [Rotaria socialis]CAF3344718.1 unnamed protein product [Rotaria socialis]CAF3435180.1 unnamed protein product [Rotaria socialis]
MSTSLDMSSATANGIHQTQINGHASQQDQIPFNIDQLAADFDLAGQDECNSSARMFERTRIQVLADERGYVQKKTFTKWVNSHLTRVGCRINDLYTDLGDGRNLIRLLEILSGERLPKATRGKMRIHCLENVDKAIMFLQEQHVHLENIGAHDIVDGNSSLILGLIWTIILRFQIQDITIEECVSTETKSAKDALLLWCQMKTADYPTVNVRNFTTSWKDGLAFCALIHKHRPDLIPQFKTLTKENANHNLQLAFDLCEKRLGISKLLDPEDVNVDYVDEKSIITYIVTLYHYFSKMKNDSVQGRRLAKVIGSALDSEKMANDYDRLVSDLLAWIEQTIVTLSDRQFPNSLPRVHEKLVDFNRYRVMDKPARFAEKGNLEVLLFTLQSKERANQQIPFQPREGKMISDVNRAWENLERAEHDRELALREEILRQERLEQLATKFNRKAGLREKWLTDSEKLVASDQFGTDLASVEAAFKKQEAIQTDIAAFEERLQNIMAIANELQTEDYHDYATIEARKKNVEMHWEYLISLVTKRRQCLELAYNLQRVFQEMQYIFEWISDLKWRLKSDDIEKYVMSADDLLQRHSLIEADIYVIDERLKRAITDADEYLNPDVNIDGYRPATPEEIEIRIHNLQKAYEELIELARKRRDLLEQAKVVSRFYSDVGDAEFWIDEKLQTMTSPDMGHDVNTTDSLVAKHKLIENDMSARYGQLENLTNQGETMVKQGHFATRKINDSLDTIKLKWDNLLEMSSNRADKLNQTHDYYQFFSDADDIDTWMLDMLKLVSSEDIGRDEPSAQTLLKKHKDTQDILDNYRQTIDNLKSTNLQVLTPEKQNSPDVQQRLQSIERRYTELIELSKLRKQKLLDAISLFRLLADADNVEAWIEEKERFLATLDPTQVNDIEELEVIKHRFDGFERDMNSTASKVAIVGHQARTLVQSDHPNSQEILDRINRLNHNWSQLRRLVDKKRDDLSSTFGVQTFHIECNETISWIQDKIRIVQSTEDLGRDLGGVMTMQRRLSGLERDMAAIQSKLDQLELEATKLEKDHPDDAKNIHNKVNQISSVWYELKEILRRREESMGEAAELQKFLRDLDHFSAWLTRTQTSVASEDIPNSLNEAEQLLNQHQTIKEEIDRYGPDYAQMKDYGHSVIRDADTTDPQYIFLRERLNALDDGWNELDQMWHQKKNMLTEAMQFQMFVRDSNQAEILLNHQEAYLAREREQKPKTLDDVESLMKKHEDFFTTMSANEDKIQGVCSFAQRLCQENHYLGDRILTRASVINDRYVANRQYAVEMNEKLQESLQYFQFIQDCDDLKEWLDMKTLQAQDDTYRDTANIHTKYLRHQAFQAEISSNKERLSALKRHAEQLREEHPQQIDFTVIDQRINELDDSWSKLEEITREKGERLFDANRSKLFQQSITNLDEFMLNIEKHLYAGEQTTPTTTTAAAPIDSTDSQLLSTTTTTTLEPVENNLTATNLLLLKQTTIEEELLKRQQQVDELRVQAEKLKQLEPEKSDEIDTKRLQVEEKFSKLLLPLEQKKLRLEQQKHLHQYLRDIEDEQIWLSEKRHLLQSYSDLIFNNKQQTLMNIQLLKRKNESLLKEIENHEQRLLEHLNNECIRISQDYPSRQEEFQERLQQLSNNYVELKDTIKQRREHLELLESLYQYYYDLSEAEAWLGEQELYMMSEERGKDELATQTFIRKQQTIDQTIDSYSNILSELNDRAKNLGDSLNQSDLSLDFVNENNDLINKRQTQLDKLYASLKDLSVERRQRLDETLKLYRLHKEIDDLEQWISDRELIAGSHELGQDFEHVSMLLDRFIAFEQETQQIGNERLQYANNMIDILISNGHIDSAQIAELKDSLNESYQDLLEMIETRLQSLKASWELHKFLHDCKEILLTMQERKNSIPDEIGRDQQGVQQLLRKHQQFETELVLLAQDIQRIQQESKRLNGRYAGEKEAEIKQKEYDVLTQWKLLQQFVDQRKRLLNDYEDLHRFFNLARDLNMWMDVMIRQMNNSDKPHDVSGVDLLINNHQSLKAEIDARQENFTMCINLGKDLINRRHPRSSEVKEKCVQLSMLRDQVDDTWNERFEYLQLILEVYQFARDAAIAETWLIAQESYLNNEELGETLDQVENLIKRHEQFEKSLLAQEDRFNALRNLTTLEKKRQMPPVEPPQSRLPAYLEEFKTWQERDAEQALTDKSKFKSIAEENTSTDGGRSGMLSGKQSSQDFDSNNNKQRRSESATRLLTIKEGFLSRKHEWEGHERKATHRAWEKYYSALTSNRLLFFKDAKHLKSGRTATDDFQLDSSTSTAPATDYRKKPNVFRLKFQDGNEYLFHAKDDTEMNEWITAINNTISSLPSTVTGATAVVTQIPSIALTSPATTTKGSASSATSSPHHPPTSVMISSTSGIQTSQSSSSNEPKSRTLPLRSSSLVEPQVSSSSSQQPPAGKKKSGGFFSMKRK